MYTIENIIKSIITIIKKPSAWIPILMSIIALVIVLGHIIFVGVAREADEGTEAHLFQLLIAGQVPIVVFFAIKWLPQETKQALKVLALQVAAAIAAFAPVFFFNL